MKIKNTLENNWLDLIDSIVQWLLQWALLHNMFARFLAAVWAQQFPIVPIGFDDQPYPIPKVYHSSEDHYSSYHLCSDSFYSNHIDMVVSSHFVDDGCCWKIDMDAFFAQMEMCVVDVLMVLTNQRMNAFFDLCRNKKQNKKSNDKSDNCMKFRWKIFK